MKVCKFLPPYHGKKTTFPKTKDRSGVYLIKENRELVYVGMSGSNLYKTLYRHFEHWTHRTQQVTTYAGRMGRNKYTVRVIFCSANQAGRLEKVLIKKTKPRDNEEKYKAYELDLQDNKVYTAYKETQKTSDPF